MKQALTDWFAQRGWKPFKFQKEVWKAIAAGESGLLHASTGSGKTYAAWLGALMEYGAAAQCRRAQEATEIIAAGGASRGAQRPTQPLTVLWITPMRALAIDTLRALQQPLDFLNRPELDCWRPQRRHRQRRAQRAKQAAADGAGHHA